MVTAKAVVVFVVKVSLSVPLSARTTLLPVESPVTVALIVKGPVVPPPPPPVLVDGAPLHADKRNASNMRQAGGKIFAADFMFVSLLCYMLQRPARDNEISTEGQVSRFRRTGGVRRAMCELRLTQHLLKTGTTTTTPTLPLE
jgi:hypothetical protein